MVQSSAAFIGMDVHKASIDIAIADAKETRHFGRIGGDGAAVDKAIRKLCSVHPRAVFVYEAGRCRHGWRILADVIDPALPAPQSLERGSSVTHDSLVASQRPHISLIDRRHFGDAALPMRHLVEAASTEMVAIGRSPGPYR